MDLANEMYKPQVTAARTNKSTLWNNSYLLSEAIDSLQKDGPMNGYHCHSDLFQNMSQHMMTLILNKVVLLFDQWRGEILYNKGVLHDQHPVSDSRNRLVGVKLSGKTVIVQTPCHKVFTKIMGSVLISTALKNTFSSQQFEAFFFFN